MVLDYNRQRIKNKNVEGREIDPARRRTAIDTQGREKEGGEVGNPRLCVCLSLSMKKWWVGGTDGRKKKKKFSIG